MAEAEKQVQAEREALEASETAKTTAREERFFKVNKAMEEVAACTSTEQMYELMVKTVRLSDPSLYCTPTHFFRSSKHLPSFSV